MRETYEAEDEVDEAAEEAAEAQAARSREARRASGTALEDDQGMYFHERAYWALRRWAAWAREKVPRGATARGDADASAEGTPAAVAAAPVLKPAEKPVGGTP